MKKLNLITSIELYLTFALHLQLKVLSNAQSFDSAICLGSVVGENLDAASRDSRVLTMLLILRRSTKD